MTDERPLLTVHNNHTAQCGTPPSLVAREKAPKYVGYYQNWYGEQWIFTYDSEVGGQLRGGDIGWNTVRVVKDGGADGLIMDDGERLWLQACWHAATDPVLPRARTHHRHD